MKIYTFFTDSHAHILYNYFIPSLYMHENATLIIKKIEQMCPKGNYASVGWFQTMIEKIKYVIEACKENYNHIFIYSDCDVQFFKPFIKQLIAELDDFDIACQNDIHIVNNKTTYCAGFFICKSSDATIHLFESILDHLNNMNKEPELIYDDQHALNDHIDLVKHTILSNKFYTIAQSKQELWNNDYDIEIPTDILVHHANWTEGIENKINLLNFIKEKIS